MGEYIVYSRSFSTQLDYFSTVFRPPLQKNAMDINGPGNRNNSETTTESLPSRLVRDFVSKLPNEAVVLAPVSLLDPHPLFYRLYRVSQKTRI